MTPYFGGADTSYYREFLYEHGVRHMSFNWLNHQRRIKSKAWKFADYFPDDARIFVDSGAAAYNREGVDVPYTEIRALYSDFYTFIELNYDRIDGFLEFDADCLAVDDIAAPRSFFDRQGQVNKVVPVWHADTGEDELLRLALGYRTVAVAEKHTDDNQLARVYRAIARQTNLHLIGADRTLLDAHIKWSSCHFAAWYSAQQHGELFVWAGHQLRRYMPDRRTHAIKRHALLFETLGIDTAKLKAGDAPESLRLAIWSWGQYFAHLENLTAPIPQTVTDTPYPVSGENEDPDPSPLAETDPEWRHDLVSQAAGELSREASAVELPELFNRTEKLSKEQLTSAYDYVLLAEGRRLVRALEREEQDGGYLDKATGLEIDRYARLLKAKVDMDTYTLSLTIKAPHKGDAQAGLLSRLFGGKPEGVSTGDNSGPTVESAVVGPAIEPVTILEAEIVSDTVTE